MSDHNTVDKLSRRGVLKCLAWSGTGILWGLRAGVPFSIGLEQARAALPDGFTFLHISDSHIGFEKAAYPDARDSYREAVAKIKALPKRASFIIHTGDISHLSKPQEFDDADQIIRAAGIPVFYTPGEHDMLDDENGKAYLERYGKGSQGAGWYSFDQNGIHFAALVNVANFKPGGMGNLGSEQLRWLKQDLAGRSASTPVVVFAHIPLWIVERAWGWGTEDGAEALSYLRRFGSVTVLNGHTHQVIQKVEGQITFHAASATSFPEPAPGTASVPEPLDLPAERIRRLLGISSVSFVPGSDRLAIVDSALADSPAPQAVQTAATDGPAGSEQVVRIDHFAFGPAALTVRRGTTVTWVNGDDAPHNVVADDKSFKSKIMERKTDTFSLTFTEPGEYRYFCTLHPYMTGKVIVAAEGIAHSRTAQGSPTGSKRLERVEAFGESRR